MANNNLGNAKRAKVDEFYTQYKDIEKEIEAYLEYDPNTFKGKIVYCNCDDPFESNFFRYFVLKFKTLGLKKLITTSYKPSPVANTQLGLFGDDKTLIPKTGRPKVTANKLIITDVGDYDGDGEFNLQDVAEQLKANKRNEWTPLKGDGDFRDPECIELLKQADIVVTNPPFSLFHEYMAQLIKYGKKFLIIGNTNAITYLDLFPHIKDNRVWLGCTNFNVGMFFEVPDDWERFHHIDKETGKKIARVSTSCWYTNLDHGRRHEPLQLMSMADNLKYSKNLKGTSAYQRYGLA